MSCSNASNLIARISGRLSGLPWLSSKRGFVSGSTAQVSFFDPQPAAKTKGSAGSGQTKPKKKGRLEKSRIGQTRVAGDNGQASFLDDSRAVANRPKPDPEETTGRQTLPTQRQVKLTKDFSTEELQAMSVQLRLGVAAVSRQIRELNSGVSRGIGHSDPRPLDWARADRQNYQFLIEQLDRVERGQAYVDTTALSQSKLVDLWEFARFEADRALRNIDHLQAGLSHLRGATADYLVDRHRLEARFYSFLAGQVERMIPPEKIAAARAWERWE